MNDLEFRKQLPTIFQHFTNWNKDKKVNTGEYINWLTYQLYLFYKNDEESDIIRWFKLDKNKK